MSRIGTLSRVHLIAGRNNVGKSSLLRLVHALSTESANLDGRPYFGRVRGEQDLPEMLASNSLEISLCFRANEDLWHHLGITDDADQKAIFQAKEYSRSDNGYVWFDFYLDDSGELTPDFQQFKAACAPGNAQTAARQLRALADGVANPDPWDTPEHNLGIYFAHVALWSFIPKTAKLEAKREITADVPEGDIYSSLPNGTGLVGTIALMERPPQKKLKEYEPKYKAFMALVRDVLEDQSIDLQVPRPDGETILLRTDSSGWLPLEALGSGIGEIIMLAATATFHEDRLICIEEPELHLHPAQQRKLIKHLFETRNRYLIATHSATLLNSPDVSISHVAVQNKHSSIQNVSSGNALALAVADLGNRASDLVQSDFVIWVEGPSDRIYVKHWLSLVEPNLLEGAHYSIVFYGGALLNHLSADEDNVDDLIELLKINRNLAVIIDSDKTATKPNLNATKERVREELEDMNAQAWVTEGYTIENYVPVTWLSDAVAKAHPRSSTYPVTHNPLESPIGAPFPGTKTYPDKVKVARFVTSRQQTLSDWGNNHLEAQISQLIDSVKKANGLI